MIMLMKNLVLSTLGLLIFIACGKTKSDQAAALSSGSADQEMVIPPPSAYKSDKEGWLVNLDEAYEKSIRENKPILANFTGSDWCGWCKRLDMDVFSKPEFRSWAEKNVVLLEVDFPKRKKLPPKNQEQNAAMAQSLNIAGYPTIWMLNVSREEVNGRFKVTPLGKTGYAKTPAEFIGALSGFLR